MIYIEYTLTFLREALINNNKSFFLPGWGDMCCPYPEIPKYATVYMSG